MPSPKRTPDQVTRPDQVMRPSAVTSPPPLKKACPQALSPGTCLPYNTVVAAGGAARVSGGTAGGAAVVGYITAGRQQGVGVAAGVAAVCPGGSTVPATV